MPKPSGASGGKPRALLVSPETPYPTHGGGAIRTASLLEYLAPRYSLDAIFFREAGGSAPPIPHEFGVRSHVVPLPRHTRTFAAKAARNLRRIWTGVPPLIDRFRGFERDVLGAAGEDPYDLVLVEHFWCAPYAPALRPVARRLVLDLHNVESVLHRRSAGAHPAGFAFRRWAEACRRLEREYLPLFDLVLVASAADAARLAELAPGVPVQVYPNALPARPQPEVPREPLVIFTGNLEYHPNVAAIQHFERRIWPEIAARCPEAVWVLAGSSGQALARRFAGQPRVRVLTPVDDAVRLLASARVAVAPLLSGSGTRLKILESWAAGTPVVSTSIGAEGLEVVPDEHIVIADTPRSFADAVTSLLSNEGRAQRIGYAGRQLYELCYTWPVAWATLSEASI